jgi:hypothetical protein
MPQCHFYIADFVVWVKLAMRTQTAFLAAAWIYFASAVLFLLALVLATWFAERPLTFGLVAVGCAFIGVTAGLGVWSWQIAKERRKASITFFSIAMLPLILSGLTPGFTALFIFGVPFSLIAWGMRKVQLAEATQSNGSAGDG